MPSSELIAEPTKSPSRVAALDIILLLAAAAILVVFRLHAFDLPLETDECNYAYIARRLLSGDRLYVDVWDHQPFGVFAMLAGIIALFGNAPILFRWTACAFSLLSLLLIFAIARRIAGRSAGAFAALLFAILSSDPGTAGEGCQREIYMNTFILAAWWLAPMVRDSALPLAKGGLGGGFLAGTALGLASTLKTIVAVHWVILAAWLFWITWRKGDFARCRSLASTLTVFAAGPILIWASASTYFALTDRWHEFLDAVFLFNVGYSEGGGFFSRFAEFFAPLWHRFIAPITPPPRFLFPFDSALPLWLLGLASTGILVVVSILGPRRASQGGTASCGNGFQPVRSSGISLLLALIAASYIATCLPGRFWPHYYYLMIPPLVLVAAITPIVIGQGWAVPTSRTCGDVFQQITSHKRERVVDGARSSVGWASPTIRGLTWVMILSCTAFFQYRHYLSQPLFGLTVNRFNSRDFWGRAQGANVASVTDPDDKIFVFGNDAEVYYYANRRCASRYTMITGLSAKLPAADRHREILLDELRRDPPRLILVLFDEDPFPEWLAFLREFYSEPVGWDFHDRTRKPIAFILARKDRPIPEIHWDWDRASVNGWAIGER